MDEHFEPRTWYQWNGEAMVPCLPPPGRDEEAVLEREGRLEEIKAREAQQQVRPPRRAVLRMAR